MRGDKTVRSLKADAMLLAGAMLLASAVQAQIDFRAPREAARPWERKLDEYNRTARQRSEEGKAADALWDAPVTPDEVAAARQRHQAQYDARRQRFGESYADNWLDRQIRNERVIESLR